MAKTKISEFSATPANNTDIDSINIAEGCAPSGINDAIRELMAQLKDFQTGAVGDSFNGPIGTSTAAAGAFTTLSASGTATLSGLTASTALALDASKNVVSVTNTGTGSNVLATSPTLVTPILGTPTSATLTNATGLPIATGVSGLGTGVATFLATPSSANLRSALTDETGTGSAVFATSPTLVTPALGSPSSVGTMPAFTLGGTVSGGGNQINNVIIGTSTPLAGTFTSVDATSVTNTGLTSGRVTFSGTSGLLADSSALTFDGTMLSSTVARFGTYASFGTESLQVAKANGTGAIGSAYQFAINSKTVNNLAEMIMTDGASANAFISYRPNATASNDKLTINLQGSDIFNVVGNGNVGIGTSSPSSALDVATSNSGITLTNTGASNKKWRLGGSSAGAFQITEAGVADRFTINTSGNVQTYGTISVGDVTPATSGAGITFPATQSASSDANTLDDYEEGTWTPTVGTQTVVGTFSSNGNYTKIGRQVFFRGQVIGSTSITGAAGSYIEGLPFTSALTGTGSGTNAFQTASAVIFIGASDTKVFVIAGYAATGNFEFSGMYFV